MTRPVPANVGSRSRERVDIRRIVVGAGSEPQAHDAARLAAILARLTGASVTLVRVRPPAPRGGLHEFGESDTKVDARLRRLQALTGPGASTSIERDLSVAKGLSRAIARERADLLVVGSSRLAHEGRVRIGELTRELLADARCPLAVAARGLDSHGPQRLSAVGVGYDDTPPSREALSRAQPLARAAGAQLRVLAVADSRLPDLGWTPTSDRGVDEIWDAVVEPNVEALRASAERALPADGADAVLEARPGSPPDELIALSREVDLLVIGSERWNVAAPRRGTAGEELMRRAHCSVMTVPPPSNPREAGSVPADGSGLR